MSSSSSEKIRWRRKLPNKMSVCRNAWTKSKWPLPHTSRVSSLSTSRISPPSSRFSPSTKWKLAKRSASLTWPRTPRTRSRYHPLSIFNSLKIHVPVYSRMLAKINFWPSWWRMTSSLKTIRMRKQGSTGGRTAIWGWLLRRRTIWQWPTWHTKGKRKWWMTWSASSASKLLEFTGRSCPSSLRTLKAKSGGRWRTQILSLKISRDFNSSKT